MDDPKLNLDLVLKERDKGNQGCKAAYAVDNTPLSRRAKIFPHMQGNSKHLYRSNGVYICSTFPWLHLLMIWPAREAQRLDSPSGIFCLLRTVQSPALFSSFSSLMMCTGFFLFLTFSIGDPTTENVSTSSYVWRTCAHSHKMISNTFGDLSKVQLKRKADWLVRRAHGRGRRVVDLVATRRGEQREGVVAERAVQCEVDARVHHLQGIALWTRTPFEKKRQPLQHRLPVSWLPHSWGCASSFHTSRSSGCVWGVCFNQHHSSAEQSPCSSWQHNFTRPEKLSRMLLCYKVTSFTETTDDLSHHVSMTDYPPQIELNSRRQIWRTWWARSSTKAVQHQDGQSVRMRSMRKATTPR